MAAQYEPVLGGTDGEGWDLSIAYLDGLAVESGGYMAYPPEGDSDHGPAFSRLIAALSEIVDGRDVRGVRASQRRSRAEREAAALRIDALREDPARLERSLPAIGGIEPLGSEQTVNWLTPDDHAGWPELQPLLRSPWPTRDARGVVPTQRGIGIVLVRLVGHPADIVASAREAERYERHFEHAVEECKRLCDVAPERLWLGTHADLAVRFCAVVDARERLGIPVYGALIGVPADDSTAGDWRRRFAGAWRTLGLDLIRRHRDALSYAIAAEPPPDRARAGTFSGAN